MNSIGKKTTINYKNWEIRISQVKFGKYEENILSMSVHELSVMRVGLVITGNKENVFIPLKNDEDAAFQQEFRYLFFIEI